MTLHNSALRQEDLPTAPTVFERKITILPQNPKYDFKAIELVRPKKRAAYARVSSDDEDQLSSYKNQCEHYTKLLVNMSNTEFIGLYADEGITGLNTRRRKEFLRLIADCRAGLIDEIWVKSVSRFARNTLDCVAYIRELRELGINVHIESLNIDTIDSKGELLITILATLAQEESRNISENVKWANRKKRKANIMTITTIYGYRKSEDGVLTIEHDEAIIVRRIFREFLDGSSASQIANKLNDEGVPTYHGKTWRAAGIIAMLENEKYKGDALLLKTFSPSLFDKKRVKITDGEEEQTLIENSHPPIVDREIHDMVQAELKLRKGLKQKGRWVGHGSKYSLSGKILCPDCGDTLRRHASYWKGELLNRTWICKSKRGKACPSKPIKEDDIKGAFVRMLNRLIGDKEAVVAEIIESADTNISEGDKAEFEAKMEELTAAREEMLTLSRSVNRSQEGRHERLAALMNKIDALTEETKQIRGLIETKKLKAHRIADINFALKNELLDEFDDTMFQQLIKHIKVLPLRELEFHFNCGIVERERI